MLRKYCGLKSRNVLSLGSFRGQALTSLNGIGFEGKFKSVDMIKHKASAFSEKLSLQYNRCIPSITTSLSSRCSKIGGKKMVF